MTVSNLIAKKMINNNLIAAADRNIADSKIQAGSTNFTRVFIILSLCCLLNGCVNYTTVEPNYDMSETELSTVWVNQVFSGTETAEEQQIAAQAIVVYLREQHPSLNPQFPYLKVRSVKIGNATSEMGLNPEEKQEIEKALTTIFETVEHDLFANRHISSHQQWPVDLIVTSYRSTWSTFDNVALATAAVPVGVLCWGSVFYICPHKNTQIFSLEIIAYPPSGPVLEATGSGGSELFQQSQLDSRGLTFSKEQNIKALVAATADAADKWIMMWKKNKFVHISHP